MSEPPTDRAGLRGWAVSRDTTASATREDGDASSSRPLRPPEISVVVPTYNRCDMLAAVLGSILAQRGDVPYEVLVADNNSTDRTAEVILSHARQAAVDVRYIRETRQGAAYARNAGIAASRAPTVAFVDDDVRVDPDWVVTLKRALDENPHVDYVGGRVLPNWPGERPAWLTDEHWSPVAILDRGDSPFLVSTKLPIVLLGANLAVRRAVLDRVGPFAAPYQHLRNNVCGGTEDHELQLRIWTAGGRGLYVPEMVVTADIQPERLTKRYHRQWHAEHGKLCSIMRVDEMIGDTGELIPDRRDDLQLFDAPAWLYHAQLRAAARWLWASLRGDEPVSFKHENRVRYYASYIGARYQQAQARRRRAPVLEVTRFLLALLRKKWRVRSGAPVGAVCALSPAPPAGPDAPLVQAPRTDQPDGYDRTRVTARQ